METKGGSFLITPYFNNDVLYIAIPALMKNIAFLAENKVRKELSTQLTKNYNTLLKCFQDFYKIQCSWNELYRILAVHDDLSRQLILSPVLDNFLKKQSTKKKKISQDAKKVPNASDIFFSQPFIAEQPTLRSAIDWFYKPLHLSICFNDITTKESIGWEVLKRQHHYTDFSTGSIITQIYFEKTANGFKYQLNPKNTPSPAVNTPHCVYLKEITDQISSMNISAGIVKLRNYLHLSLYYRKILTIIKPFNEASAFASDYIKYHHSTSEIHPDTLKKLQNLIRYDEQIQKMLGADYCLKKLNPSLTTFDIFSELKPQNKGETLLKYALTLGVVSLTAVCLLTTIGFLAVPIYVSICLALALVSFSLAFIQYGFFSPGKILPSDRCNKMIKQFENAAHRASYVMEEENMKSTIREIKRKGGVSSGIIKQLEDMVKLAKSIKNEQTIIYSCQS